MKRHPALIPISRQHHLMLLLAQLLKKNAPEYRGLPTTLEGKAKYAWELYETQIKGHFEVEEEKLIPFIKLKDAEIQKLIQEIKEEHQLLRNYFSQIQDQSYDANLLDTLGRLLENHIRKEERVFFQRLQALLDQETLEALKNHLGH